MAKIAIIDLLFNWPPDGGARTDVKEVVSRLAKDHEVCLFVPDLVFGFPRGRVEQKLSFAIKRIHFNIFTFNLFGVPKRFKKEVDRYKPDFIFIADGWYLKPYLVNALKAYRPILRFYAYESLCLRGHGVFYANRQCCFKDYLSNSIISYMQCMKCSLKWILASKDKKFIQEFFASLAFLPIYRHAVISALKNAGHIIVYNDFIKQRVERFNKNILIIPSGVNKDLFFPLSDQGRDKLKIFMAGRVDDSLKGVSVLIDACKKLKERKYEFELILTTDRLWKEDYIKSVGWKIQEELALLYREADICVVPSIWPEPFGITVLEAMSSAKPVIVTNVGGMRSILEDGKEGFIVEPNNPEILSKRLEELLKDFDLRQKMGEAGRKKVCEAYDWDAIYDRYYRFLFNQPAGYHQKMNYLKDYFKKEQQSVANGKTFTGPEIVQIDVTNQCNLNCVVCWYNSPVVKELPKEWKHKKMDYEVFTRLVEDLACLGTKEVSIVSDGDSFTHPRIIEMVEVVKKNGLYCQLFTNGTLLNEEKIQRLLNCNLDRLSVDLWASDEETFERIHPGCRKMFSGVVNSLKRMNELKLAKYTNSPELHLNTVVFNENFSRIAEIAKFHLNLGAKVIGFELAELSGERNVFALSEREMVYLLKDAEKLKIKLEKCRWVHTNIDYFISTLKLKHRAIAMRKDGYCDAIRPEVEENMVNKIPCYVGWLFARVNVNGEVFPCCGCGGLDFCMGNVNVSRFRDIWFSSRWDEFRSQAVKVANKDEHFFSKMWCLYRCPFYQQNLQFDNFLKI